MRTNIDIDDDLMERALRTSGLPTKRAAVEAGLRLLVKLEEQKEILGLAGQVHWQGALAGSRLGRLDDDRPEAGEGTGG
jgi:Arc/MetJ family transcription regulator